jgi:hypothetical protein
MPELRELCGGVVMPPSTEEVRSNSHEISVVASSPSHALGSEKTSVVDAAVDMHLVLFGDGLLNQGCWLRYPELLSPERLATFLPPWLVRALDP